MSEPMQNWVIYNHPSDYPENFVVRCWLVSGDGMEATPEVWLRGSLLAARRVIAANFPGATNMGRMPGDDVSIAEVWV